jgi:osmotically-inducible protein OsmY
MSKFTPTLTDRIDNALVTNPYLTGRTLRFETDGGRVILRGNVGTWYQKQMAQELVRRVEGVELIDNCLEVVGSAV